MVKNAASWFAYLLQAWGGFYPPDGDVILPVLSFLSRETFTSVNVVDVGANVGDFAGQVVESFGGLEVRRRGGGSSRKILHLLAVEPSPLPFAIMLSRASRHQWNTTGEVEFVQAAAGDRDGTAILYGCDGDVPDCINAGCMPKIENHCSLSPDASMIRQYRQTEPDHINSIQIMKLDSLLPLHFGNAQIFLLKLDCEGHDHEAIAGAERILSEQRVDWLLFETSPRWQMDGMSGNLLGTVAWLGSFGYACFALLPGALVPLDSSAEWHSVGETVSGNEWNILCAQRTDPSWSRFIHAYSYDTTALQYALDFLQDSSSAREIPWTFRDPQLKQKVAMMESFASQEIPAEHVRLIGDRFFFGDAASSHPRNQSEAMRWYLRAAEHGDAAALQILSLMAQHNVYG